MSHFRINSVQGRLWGALALLSLTIVAINVVTWLVLQRVDGRLQALHQETLSHVASALDFSKRSADLAATAPYLLNQRSHFLIQQEGAALLATLAHVNADWPDVSFGGRAIHTEEIETIVSSLSLAVRDLIDAATRLDEIQSEVRIRTVRLDQLRELASKRIEAPRSSSSKRLDWWSLQSMNANTLNAAFASNLIGAGEEQRQFLRKYRTLEHAALTNDQRHFLSILEDAALGESSIFEQRRQELSANIDAQNALFRIRLETSRISDLANDYTLQAETFLSRERDESSRMIHFASATAGIISLGSLALALASALYVSRYVTFNVSRISAAMVNLASGDTSSNLPRAIGGQDEIGDLFRSFRAFRANALRLDRSNRLLDQRNALFEKVFLNISDGIAITDEHGRTTASSPALEKILKLDPGHRSPRHFTDWLLGSRFASNAENLELSAGYQGVCEVRSTDGQILELRASQLPDRGRVWLVSDVTERRQMEYRLRHIDRIEALGKVAGDTAHDFANVLSMIRTYVHLLEPHVHVGHQEKLSAIESATDLGTSLTERLLAFARKQHLSPETVELNTLVEGTIELAEIGLKPSVRIISSNTREAVYVKVDPGQFEAALFNLIINANNAIQAEGTITVSIIILDSAQVHVRVTDNGCGMSEDTRTRAIEPFFTTRGTDGGTGLGLSIVYGFIRQTGGDLNIESKPNSGTTVTVSLPVAKEACDSSLPFDGKTALLVEDNERARAQAATCLKSAGFDVKFCATGDAAIQALTDEQFDLLITDIDLGGEIDGYDLAAIARSNSSGIQILLISGKSRSICASEHTPRCVDKPLTLQKLMDSFS